MLKKNTNYVMFCVNDDLYSYVERLDTVINIAAFSDNSESKFGKHLMGDDRICISPENISSIENCFVIICSKNTKTIHEIEEQMNEKKIPHATISEFMKNIECKEISVKWPQQINRDKVKKFIEILVHGTTFCNLHCDYCYVWKKKDFTYERKSSDYSPYMFRKALSQKRLGGICHINLCALGETLFAENIEEYVFELADEGHYISIITNGTITTVIKKICEFPIEIQKHIFFKLSFHYAELIKKNLYEKFWESVEIIKSSFCSFTIEITPSDLIIDSIDEIRKEFKDKADGAMPHITFTRDATKKGLDLYSELSLDKYRQIWGQFNSALFDLKSTLYKR